MSSPINQTGAALPPPGQIPNFDHPQDERFTIHLALMISAQVIVTAFFLIHVYVRLLAVKNFQLEDWSYVLGWMFTTSHNITVFIKIHFGEGFHIWEIRASCYTELQKSFYIGTIVFSPAAFFTKAAILLLVIRIFSIDRNTTRILYTILAFFLVCHIVALVAKALVCIPIEANWDRTIPIYKCIDQTKVFTYDTSLGVISDLTILAVPIALMAKLQIPRHRKAKFVGILGAGGLAVGVTACRLGLLYRFQNTEDPTVDFVPIDWTATGEVTIGLVLPNIPRTVSSWRAKGLWLARQEDTNHQQPDGDIELAVLSRQLSETGASRRRDSG